MAKNKFKKWDKIYNKIGFIWSKTVYGIPGIKEITDAQIVYQKDTSMRSALAESLITKNKA